MLHLRISHERARKHLEDLRWPDGVTCPVCGGKECVTPRKNGFYRCNPCKEDFTVRTGTIFERSKVPLQKWLCAIYLGDLSVAQLATEIDVTIKTARYIRQRIGEAGKSRLHQTDDHIIKYQQTDDHIIKYQQTVDHIIKYQPKPKSEPAKRRRRKKRKIERSING